MVSWGSLASTTFLTADVLVGISLTIFCIIILTTILKGKIPIGSQKFGARHDEQENSSEKIDGESIDKPI